MNDRDLAQYLGGRYCSNGAEGLARLEIEEESPPWECAHARLEARMRRIRGGGIQYAKQCLRCGYPVGGAIKASEFKVLPPEWDYDAAEKWQALQRARSLRIREADEEARRAASDARREEYQAYLQTPEWRERRRLVLERERHVCQGCRNDRATEVHHLNYRHIGSELLFDLVALCRYCHEKAHGNEAVDDA